MIDQSAAACNSPARAGVSHHINKSQRPRQREFFFDTKATMGENSSPLSLFLPLFARRTFLLPSDYSTIGLLLFMLPCVRAIPLPPFTSPPPSSTSLCFSLCSTFLDYLCSSKIEFRSYVCNPRHKSCQIYIFRYIDVSDVRVDEALPYCQEN